MESVDVLDSFPSLMMMLLNGHLAGEELLVHFMSFVVAKLSGRIASAAASEKSVWSHIRLGMVLVRASLWIERQAVITAFGKDYGPLSHRLQVIRIAHAYSLNT